MLNKPCYSTGCTGVDHGDGHSGRAPAGRHHHPHPRQVRLLPKETGLGCHSGRRLFVLDAETTFFPNSLTLLPLDSE